MKTKGLKKAERLFRTARYGEVIRVLEPQVFLYRENAAFYYMLGVSCLRTGDVAGAYSFLSRATHIADSDIPCLLALAAAEVRRRRSDEALQIWLSVLELDPRNRIARRGLALLRSADSEAVIHEAVEGERIGRFLPPGGIALPRRAWLAAGVAAVAVVAVIVTPMVVGRLGERGTTVEHRSGSELARIAPVDVELVEYQGQFRYVLTEPEIRRSFERMGDYFNAFRDNLAMIEINRILNSNAAADLKRRAALIADYIRAPGFADFTDNAAYAEVVREPWLYAGSYVRWSGRISNLDVSDEEIRFDLLVGYETQRVLEGIVPVRMRFAARLQPAMSVEIIGRVIADDRLHELEVTSIRMIAPEAD
ncbi:MAG: hypothetical protein EA384_04490 [Spirochaetaceae bacterium]|nr:MAG: hypothetical protein EA384_04490 [Spirochaetaceae bacterium]